MHDLLIAMDSIGHAMTALETMVPVGRWTIPWRLGCNRSINAFDDPVLWVRLSQVHTAADLMRGLLDALGDLEAAERLEDVLWG